MDPASWQIGIAEGTNSADKIKQISYTSSSIIYYIWVDRWKSPASSVSSHLNTFIVYDLWNNKKKRAFNRSMDYTSQKFEVTYLFHDVPGLLDSFYNRCTVSGDSSVSFPIISLSVCGNLVDCEGLFQSSYHFFPCNFDSLLEVLEFIKQRETNIAHLG